VDTKGPERQTFVGLDGHFYGRWFAISAYMRVRITRPPRGAVDGMSLHYYHAGEAYDVPPQLAEYLVAEGFASIEMRQRQRSSRQRTHDRRRSSSSRA
jgi:hypothetical protein